MLSFYHKFCCGLFYLLKNTFHSDIPFFATYMATNVLFFFYFIIFDKILSILFSTSYSDNPSSYLIVGFFYLINYYFIFKDKRFLNSSNSKMKPIWVSIICISSMALYLTLIISAKELFGK